MPPAVIIGSVVAGAAATGLAAAGLGVLIGGSLITTFAVTTGLNLVLGGLSAALAPKPKSADFTAQVRDRTHVVRSSIAPRRIIYGETVASGPLVFAAATGAAKEYLHLVIPVAGHEVDLISDVYFNDLISTDARFTGNNRVKAALGTDAQVADSDLVAEVTDWTTDHRLRGIAYVYVRLTWNADVWPTGIPNIKALIRGRKVYDPRDAGTRWSNNPALVIRDYLTASFGLQCTSAEIDDTSFIAAANVCDEAVAITNTADVFTADEPSNTFTRTTFNSLWQRGDTMQVSTTGTLPAGLVAATDYYLIPVSAPGISPGTFKLASTYANAQAGTAIDITTAGSGTHTATRTAQARYTCDGAFERDMKPLDIVEHLVASCAGALIYQQGTYRLYAGAATANTTDLGESDLRGSIRVRPKAPRRDLANAVKGTYVEPWAAWQPADYPPVLNATYETQDGSQRIEREMHFAFCQDQTRAQRLAKIALETARQGITVEFPAKLTALKVAVWDVVRLTIAALGWTNKSFRVVGWQLAEDGGVDLRLQEYAASVYTWAAGEATLYDPAPDTTLPSPGTVGAPSGLILTSGTAELLELGEGSVVSRIKAAWTAPSDSFVSEYEVQAKKSADSLYVDSIFVRGGVTAYISPVEDGTLYDVRVRAANYYGVKSAWIQSLSHLAAGKSEAPPIATAFAIEVASDGTRIFTWDEPSPLPADVRSGGGYHIRYFLGSTSDWSAMTPLHSGKLMTSPLETNELAAGTYTFAIKTIDSSGNESTTAAFINSAVLGDPRLAGALLFRNEYALGWPGTKTDCFVDTDGILYATGLQTWNDLAAAWSSLAATWETIVTSDSPMEYTTPTIDLGTDVTMLPIVSTNGSGTPTLTMQTGLTSDGAPTGAFIAFTTKKARYIKIRCSVAGSTPNLNQMNTIIDAPSKTETFEDVNVATESAAWFSRTAAGHFKIATEGDLAAITQAQLTALQSVGAGWTWELLSKTATVGSQPAAEFKTYNGSGTLADATVDVQLRGPRA